MRHQFGMRLVQPELADVVTVVLAIAGIGGVVFRKTASARIA